MERAVSIRQLARDHSSGSAELALRACRIFEASCSSQIGTAEQPASAMARCGQLARAVVAAQPSMAAVLNVANRWLCAVERGEAAALAARRLAGELEKARQATAVCAAARVGDGAVVMTYSASSTILAALLACRKAGRRFRVLCSESRPMLEGRWLAVRLAEKKVSVDLFTDAALLSVLPAADLVLVGCDAIRPDSFINKVGTYALLSMARRFRIPFYVVADSFKFLPRKLENWFHIRTESAVEVWKAPGKSILVRNFYFERVPLRGCSAVISDTGVWPPGKIRGILQKSEVASGLRSGTESQDSGDTHQESLF